MVMTMFGLNRGHLVLLPMVFIGVYRRRCSGWLAAILLGGLSLLPYRRAQDPARLRRRRRARVLGDDRRRAHSNISIVGWPLALLIIGGLVLAFAVTDTRNNSFTLTGHRDAGRRVPDCRDRVLITVERMAFLWSNGVTLAIAAVATALFALFALAQPTKATSRPGRRRC
jgi:hypothetical protein